MSKVNYGNWTIKACAILLLWAATAVVLPAQTFTTIYNFCSQGGVFCTDGIGPYGGLVQGTNGNFYGTTVYGGANNTCFESACGTVFEITPSGTLTTLHSFDSTDGANPFAGLVQGTNGTFYGTTVVGGANSSCGAGDGCGTVFKITPSGTLTSLHSFDGTDDGYGPLAGLVQATNGNFYGTTSSAGANEDGTVFKIAPNGVLATLHSFDITDGRNSEGTLVQATDGKFYGTTEMGGTNGYGTVFKITPNGTLTTLYSFCPQSNCADGAYPDAGLVQATDGNFYGTTRQGGSAGGSCAIQNGCGTVFRITPSGTLTTLYSFCSQSNCADGEYPYAGLVQATDGKFYATTSGGGATGDGTVFKITPSGTLTTLHSFDGTDGYDPYAGLIQGTDGKFYGTTYYGGAGPTTGGTVFSLAVGLGPFVETNPASGNVGAAVKILGTNLTGATSVTFNGTAATFTVISESLIRTTVPLGATTGTIQVVTPGGTLSSNVPFRVTLHFSAIF